MYTTHTREKDLPVIKVNIIWYQFTLDGYYGNKECAHSNLLLITMLKQFEIIITMGLLVRGIWKLRSTVQAFKECQIYYILAAAWNKIYMSPRLKDSHHK